MPSLIFLIPVLSSTMVPVARTVVVILETFLLEEIDLFVLEEKTLLLLARDADKDMDKTEEAILMMCYQFYLHCCVWLRLLWGSSSARVQRKRVKLTSLSSSEREKKVKIREILFSFGEEDIFFSFSLSLKKKQENQHEANLLQLNCDKAKQILGWSPRWDSKKTIYSTAKWYKVYLDGGDIESCTKEQIYDFYQELRWLMGLLLHR